MSFTALRTMTEVEEARRVLDSRGHSCLSPSFLRTLKRWHLWPGLVMGDRLKSWDVERISSTISSALKPGDPVLDIGAFCSEILPVLHKCGFTRLTGIDFNPRVDAMPFAGQIKYLVGDFHRCPVEDLSQQAVTAVSVIEHGFQPVALLTELKRILRPGGLFLATCDYWPQRIDTKGKTFFNMSWTLFSRSDIEAFVAQAAEFGFEPVGPMVYEVDGKPAIHWDGFDYTFALLILRKRS